MRGDPPLIGCALRRTHIIAAIGAAVRRAPMRRQTRGYNRRPVLRTSAIRIARPLPQPSPARRNPRHSRALLAIRRLRRPVSRAASAHRLPPPARTKKLVVAVRPGPDVVVSRARRRARRIRSRPAGALRATSTSCKLAIVEVGSAADAARARWPPARRTSAPAACIGRRRACHGDAPARRRAAACCGPAATTPSSRC